MKKTKSKTKNPAKMQQYIYKTNVCIFQNISI